MKKEIIFNILCVFTSFVFAEGKYSLYKDNGKYGLIDKNKKIVLNADYEEIKFNDVYLCKSKEIGNYIYDENLNVLHKFEEGDNKIIMTSPFLFYLSRGEGFYEKYYLYNLNTDEIIDAHNRFFEGNISGEPWICSQSRYHSYDLQIQVLQCDKAYPYRSNRAVILNYDWEGEIIDENFNTVLNHIYASADYYSEGLIPVILYAEGGNSKNNLRGKSYYVDLNGNIVYECDFDFNEINRDTIKHIQNNLVIGSFNEGVAVVQKSDESWVILDRDFNKYYLSEGCKVESTSYSNGLLLISKIIDGEKRYGFVDKRCNVAIPFEYTNAKSFDGKYAIVTKDGIEGIIDNKNRFTPNSKLKIKK